MLCDGVLLINETQSKSLNLHLMEDENVLEQIVVNVLER